jgi:predicted CoA-substrate-specific enzyme activase
MIYAGCDLGISTAKVVVTENRTILASEIVPYKSFPQKAAMEGALCKAGLSDDGIVSCLATGYGRKAIPFANQTATDPTCLLRGLRELNPQVKTIIDVGANTVLVSNINRNWKLLGMAITEECVAGTGLFIEMMANALEFPIEELASGSITSDNPVQMTNTCVVLAESEMVSLINEGYSRFDIFAGITLSVARTTRL